MLSSSKHERSFHTVVVRHDNIDGFMHCDTVSLGGERVKATYVVVTMTLRDFCRVSERALKIPAANKAHDTSGNFTILIDEIMRLADLAC